MVVNLIRECTCRLRPEILPPKVHTRHWPNAEHQSFPESSPPIRSLRLASNVGSSTCLDPRSSGFSRFILEQGKYWPTDKRSWAGKCQDLAGFRQAHVGEISRLHHFRLLRRMLAESVQGFIVYSTVFC